MTSMNPVQSGTSAVELGTEGWEKPWSGTNGGSCVEAKRLPDGSVALRQSKDPEGPALVYTRDEMIAFLEGAKSGRADFLVA
ncbi:DUF397 domain-containing protein [Streptomyces sp. BH-SS-21]|uniref:DUF397 domain-containing protein n=1 Tax=Streptomyces liliiviolaceus TaxID=2823109 RepID=A0A940Y281_9ACTN|nr:DUF397 domain-containing protein [Streptomyces liliiviolaceus]MBQ0851601.1 DUF397 domain-containing protein [Streptomyces liliiviolaceus]